MDQILARNLETIQFGPQLHRWMLYLKRFWIDRASFSLSQCSRTFIWIHFILNSQMSIEECSKIFCHSIILIGLVSRRILIGWTHSHPRIGKCSVLWNWSNRTHSMCLSTPSDSIKTVFVGVLSFQPTSFSCRRCFDRHGTIIFCPFLANAEILAASSGVRKVKIFCISSPTKTTFKKDGLSMLMLVWEEQFQNLKILIKYTHMAQQHQPA